jgi:hypothetical protein
VIEHTIYVRATPGRVRRAVAGVPADAQGGGHIARAMMARCGMVLLALIRAAFLVKARGGTDEAGDSWKPLSPRTIAYSRRNRKLPGNPQESRLFSRAKSMPWIPKSGGRAAYAPSYALTNKQNTRWWEVYRQQLAVYRGNKGHAAAVAWIILKRDGATTLMEQYGHMKVDILRDTFALFNTLSPGTSSAASVFRVLRGEVIVGTNRKWAGVHHRGSSDGRIPQRRLWPEVRRWPSSWWEDILEQAQLGVVDLVLYVLGRL